MVDAEGGCLCGKVRYKVSAEPVFAGVCHCKNCQKGSGSAFSVVLAIPSAGLTVTGTLKEYVGRGDSGNATTKKFCPECGSPIAIEAEHDARSSRWSRSARSTIRRSPNRRCTSIAAARWRWVPIPEGVGMALRPQMPAAAMRERNSPAEAAAASTPGLLYPPRYTARFSCSPAIAAAS